MYTLYRFSPETVCFGLYWPKRYSFYNSDLDSHNFSLKRASGLPSWTNMPPIQTPDVLHSTSRPSQNKVNLTQVLKLACL